MLLTNAADMPLSANRPELDTYLGQQTLELQPMERQRQTMPKRFSGEATSGMAELLQQPLLEFAMSQSSAIFYIANASDGFSLRFITANVEKTTGYGPAAFVQDGAFKHDQVHVGDKPGYHLWLERLIELQATSTHSYRFRTASGEFRWLRDECRVVQTADAPAVLVGCIVDITALKQKEQVLEESERRFRLLVESHPLPVWLVELESGRILYSSPAIEKVTGEPWKQDEENFAQSYYVDPEERIGRVKRLRETGEVRNYETLFKKADGSAIWISLTSRLLVIDGRELVISSFVDLTDQRRREADLRRARETLEDAIEALSEGLVIYDSDDRFLMCNSQYRRFHRDCEDLLVPGTAWPEITRARAERGLFKQAEGRVEEWIEGQLAQRGVATNQEFLFTGNRWFEYSHRPTRQGGFVSTWCDITERKRMEQALRESEALIRQILEACPVPVLMWSLEADKVIYENPASQALFDWDATRLEVGDRLKVYTDLADRERYLARLRDKRFVNGMEMQFQRFDGRLFWASVSGRLVEFKGKEVVVSTYVDLSERKEMEQALRKSEELVRHVLEACPVPITMNRVEDGVIIYESPAAQTLLGYDRSQEGESVVPRWVETEDRRDYITRLRRNRAVNDLEYRYRKANGETFWCGVSSRLIDYRGEEVIVSNLHDLTDRRAAEAELVRQREIVYQSEKLSALGELLAGVSHELNNPLMVLVGQAQMLQDRAPDEETARRAEKIATAAGRCTRIVKTFLAMARQEPSDLVPVEVNSVVESALELTCYSLRTHGIDVCLRLAKDLPTIDGDADQLRQVLINLIVNADHAMQEVNEPRRLRISSSYRKKSKMVVVKVKDSGLGIADEIRSRIFEPLFTTKEVGSGTGMGLALCHRLVEAHGGTISVDSSPGQGASFSIRLPRTQQEGISSAGVQHGAGQVAMLRVLVVDDDYDVGQIISDMLRHEGHLVDVAGSGPLALEMVKRQRYDVILSDVRMPGMDGPGFYRVLGEIKPEQIDGLVFMTGDTLSPGVRDFLDASERPYLEKPLALRDLRGLLELLMRRKTR